MSDSSSNSNSSSYSNDLDPSKFLDKKMFSCPIHGAELLTANDGSSGNGHMMQWFNEESLFD
ncbi:hypothetical protein OsJ_28478 [Oryza sativa Japonica Group]|uniref:Uncharacterized protein n=1 Tax=Oryza sativa subsp. japonica TaxID=39947 RepID=A3BWC2_ORYSJ|nr:hypothetical protein OsJ_28478 [Oryza sativa Japonica Group]